MSYFTLPVGEEQEGVVVEGRGGHGPESDVADDAGRDVVDTDEGVVARD